MYLKLPTRLFRNVVIALVLLNLFFLDGTWLHYTLGGKTGNITRFLLLQLDLAYENVLSAWYSSILLFLVAIMCVGCFIVDAKRFRSKADAYVNFGWIILSLVFATLSLDELGSFHETIGDTSIFEIFGKTEGWQVFYILIILVGGFMILFGWLRLRRMPLATFFMIAGVLLFLSNPLQENFEIGSMQNSVNPLQWKRPVIFILLEEGSEVFATICFLLSTMIYYSYALKKMKDGNIVTTKHSSSRKSKFQLLQLTTFVIIILGIAMAITDQYIQREAGNDIGIPKNWFPAIMTFMTFIISLSFYNNAEPGGLLFLFTAIASILISVYCGIDLYEHYFNELRMGEKIFDWIMIISIIILGTGFLRRLQGIINKLLVCLWTTFAYLAFNLYKSHTPEFIFAGFSCLLIALMSIYSNQTKGENFL